VIGFDGLHVDLAIVLGKTRMPLHQLLRMSRGATMALEETWAEDEVEILANGHPVARGQVTIRGDAISVEITKLVRKPEPARAPGLTIGGRMKPGPALQQAA
jgi:flagellar motor switch protein FliN/FliY